MSDDIDIGQISEALNDKMDRDVGNPAAIGKERMSGFGMPSDTIESLTLGASDDEYTAPANGYYTFGKESTASGQVIYILIQGTKIVSQAVSTASSQGMRVWIPVRKGQKVNVGYTTSGTTNWFNFVYAEGEI